MLKIKNGVDLKELEKFGLVYDDWCNNYVLCEDSIVNGNFDEPYRYYILSVDVITREIVFETNDSKDYINVLFDLIQANLVEKVEE